MAEVDVTPALLKPARFAKLIDASRSTVYLLINQGEIKAVKIGGNIRIPATELTRLQQLATAEQRAE